MKPVTIKQISEKTGFSVNTVSRALSDRGEISPVTAERIRQVAAELGYVPNLLARGLAGRRSGTIGLIMGESQNPFHWPIVEGIQRELTQKGLNLVLANSEDSAEGLRRAVNLLLSSQVDGLLMFFPDGGEDSLRLLRDHNIPFVLIGTETDKAPASCIDVDNYHGGYLAATHLYQRGCKKIAFMARRNDAFPSEKRQQGYAHAVQEGNLQPEGPILFHAEATLDGGYRFAVGTDLLAQGIDGIVAHNDLMAMGIMRGLAEQGVSVPEQMAVIGFDNIPFDDYCHPPLSTIHIQNERLGVLSIEMLLRQVQRKLDDKPLVDEVETLLPELVVRKST